ncbi:TIGR01777 family protein [Pseudoalteromonas sp. MSK9-3]|uniref:TIGR01777 family oxidoreductase n=1 Tax=Pseudoalteromonas sp. MSK9-3 TaxID=1897633 RepID=UPI000E6B78E3|nr:TIGR01777 family oxidoreductase [Pseudoalteromonas sp. MSK9-3]RJE70815.1 TIGR01777 family protein [Pseudoalteromonas sp. MSK9-3]
MKVLITGATGLIGRQLCQELYQEHELIALTRHIARAKSILPDTVTCINTLNDTDFNALDVIINLAGEPIADKRWSDQQKEKILTSRLTITQQLVEKIKLANSPPHTLISGSAIGFYGRQSSHIKINETFTDCTAEFSNELCEQWEDLALSAQQYNTRVCIVRTGVVLSAQGGALAKMVPPFKMGLGGKVSSGEQMMSWIHIDDMVNIIVHLMENTALNGKFNATAPSPVSNIEFTKTLSSVLKRPAIIPMPNIMLRLLFGEMADLLIYGQAVVPDRLTKDNFQFKYKELHSALNDILI